MEGESDLVLSQTQFSERETFSYELSNEVLMDSISTLLFNNMENKSVEAF